MITVAGNFNNKILRKLIGSVYHTVTLPSCGACEVTQGTSFSF
jgi:hypothetical protein